MTTGQPATEPAPDLMCPDCHTLHDSEIALMWCCNDADLARVRHHE